MRHIIDVAGQFYPNKQAADKPTAEERQGEGEKYSFPSPQPTLHNQRYLFM